MVEVRKNLFIFSIIGRRAGKKVFQTILIDVLLLFMTHLLKKNGE
jgi:hypothetical protein